MEEGVEEAECQVLMMLVMVTVLCAHGKARTYVWEGECHAQERGQDVQGGELHVFFALIFCLQEVFVV
jgi:hypothetical protein